MRFLQTKHEEEEEDLKVELSFSPKTFTKKVKSLSFSLPIVNILIPRPLRFLAFQKIETWTFV